MAHTNGKKPGPVTSLHTTAAKRKDLAEILRAIPGTHLAAQCQRLSTALSRYSLSTFEAMRYLDCYYPPARIMQLRRSGLDIDTHWVHTVTEAGEKHRVGLYVLAPAKKGAKR